jgi:mannose/fructose/N-acetylgalactosamine-specific phosphotransferase system component IIB
MIIFRVDDRLIHGQVVENWIPTFGISSVIVANDLISDDELRKNIMKFSIPSNVKIDFLKIDDLKGINFDERKNYLVLFENLRDVWRAVLEGVKIDELNIGGIHYAKGRNFSFGKVMFLSDEEKEILKKLSSYGVSVYLQPIPQEKKVKVVEII